MSNAVQLRRIVAAIDSGVSVVSDASSEGATHYVLKTSSVSKGQFDVAERKAVTTQGEIARLSCPVEKDRLVVSRMNTPGLVGACGFVEKDWPNTFLPDRLWLVRLRSDLCHPKFVYWWTNTEGYRAQVQSACAGTSQSMQNISQDQFLGFALPWHSLEAQTAIANYLDAKTAVIDALIAKKGLLIEELKNYQDAIVTEAVLGARLEKSKIKSGEAADMFAGYSEYPLLPAKRIFQRKKQLNEGMACSNRLSLTMGGVVPRDLDDVNGLQASEYESYQRVEPGDLLFKLIDLENIKTSRVGLVPTVGIVSPAYIRLAAREPGQDVEYFYWYFYALYLNNVFNSMGGGVRQALGPTELLDILIPVPSKQVRARIVADLTTRVGRVKAVLTSTASSIAELKRLRASLISEAVTGKLKLTD